MERLTINVNKQMDGFIFSLDPLAKRDIKQEFPAANPITSIFISYDTKASFEALYGKMQKHIYPALVGIDSEDDLKKIRHIEFIDFSSKKTLYAI